jgi:tRNA-2-methylthio-N6-dimethylallyladenosine synthase
MTASLVRALRDLPKVCRYLHLPLQSGSNRVLARMRRGYTREEYLDLIAELKEAVPDLALSTDLIVGFPGESEADFQATLDAVERVAYDNVFAFRYSPRPGTPAAEMPDQVPGEEKAARNTRLLEVAGRVAARRGQALVGRTVPVLVDGAARKNPAEVAGRTECNRVVNFDGEGRAAAGTLASVRITAALPHSLRGTLVASPEDAACLSK